MNHPVVVEPQHQDPYDGSLHLAGPIVGDNALGTQPLSDMTGDSNASLCLTKVLCGD